MAATNWSPTGADLVAVQYDAHPDADAMLSRILPELSAIPHEVVKMPGKGGDTVLRRQTLLVANAGVLPVKYAGKTLQPYDVDSLPAGLTEVAAVCKEVLQHFYEEGGFNGIIINVYPDGDVSLSYHSDDESVGPQGTAILGFSLGAERDILFKHNSNGSVVSIPLPHNSAYLMYPGAQQMWKHSIPKRKKVVDVRVSFTLRRWHSARCAYCMTNTPEAKNALCSPCQVTVDEIMTQA